MLKPLLTLSFGALIVASCNYKEIKNENLNKENDLRFDKATTAELSISYSTIKDHVLNVCLTCHIGHTKPELGSLDEIRNHLAEISSRVHLNNMPPARDGYDPLNDCQKAILDEWIADNAPLESTKKVGELRVCNSVDESLAPETTPEPSPLPTTVPTPKPSPLPTTVPTPEPSPQSTPFPSTENSHQLPPLIYSSVFEKILKPRCVVCHSHNSSASFLLFYPYEDLLKGGSLWMAPGFSNQLIQRLKRTDSLRMPPLYFGEGLTKEEIDFITQWIDAGLPQ